VILQPPVNLENGDEVQIEHMSPRGRYRTCQDAEIDLTDDAKVICARPLNVAPGERTPGSER
jgi:hypothetical protein